MSLATIDSGVTQWAERLVFARQLGDIVASTDFVPGAMRGNPDACAACVMYGLEIGITPMQALNSIHVVDGRPQPSAELVRAMILSAGHEIVVHALTDETCRVSGLRAGQDESKRTYVEWSTAQARRAGLLNRQNWQRYPRAMLLARATGDLGRLAFPDVVKGLGHIREDQGADLDDWAQQVAPTEAPPVAPKRTRVTRKAAAELPSTPLPEVVPDGTPEPGAVDPWADPSPATGPRSREPAPEPPADDGPPVAPPSPRQSPEQPAAQPGDPAPMGDRMRQALMANFSSIGVDPTRDRAIRLALASALLGRGVDTFNSLTRGDGLHLFRLLNDIETGALDWEYHQDRDQVTVRPGAGHG